MNEIAVIVVILEQYIPMELFSENPFIFPVSAIRPSNFNSDPSWSLYIFDFDSIDLVAVN